MKEKGLYAYLYSKPDKWDFSAKRIKNDHKDGRDSVLSGLRKLEESGYLSRKKLPNGRVVYTIFCKPKTEKPTVGKVVSGENRTVSNKDPYKQREVSNNPLTPLKRGRREIHRRQLELSLTTARPYYEEEGGDFERIIDRLWEGKNRFLFYTAAYLYICSTPDSNSESTTGRVWAREKDYIATLTVNLKPLINADLEVTSQAFIDACKRIELYDRRTIRTAIAAL